MAAWAPGSWAADAWAGTAWDESAPTVGAAWFSTAWAAGAWGSAAWANGGAVVPVITAIVPDETSIEVTYTGTADEYRIDEGAPAAIGASPATITGLTVNTEYDSPGLQLRNDGGDWSSAVPFGTLNPGEGGGGVGTLADVTPADGAATTSTLVGRAEVRSAITPAAGVATAGTLGGVANEAGSALISPAAGVATTSTLVGAARVRASITAAAGVATTATLSGEVAGAPTLTIRVLDKAEAGSPLASSTGWDCFWYDDATTMAEAVATTPTVSLPGQSADSLGRLVLTLAGSSKGSGEFGFLMFSNGDGSTDQSPPPRSFAALVPVD